MENEISKIQIAAGGTIYQIKDAAARGDIAQLSGECVKKQDVLDCGNAAG